MGRTAVPKAPVGQHYDLGQLAEMLAAAYPVQRLYLFGSRRHRTRSVRSDVDVLVEANEHIRPRELRDFAAVHCRALDLFILDDRKATSCQNGSYVEAPTKDDLLAKLDAVEFWSRTEGRLAADIDWTFELQPDVTYRPTEIVAPSQPPARDPSTWTIGEIVARLRPAHLWGVLAAIVALVAGSFGAGIWIGKNLLSRDDSVRASQAPDDGRSDIRTKKAQAQAEPRRRGEVPSIELHGPIDANALEEEMQGLRKERHLRRLTVTESGRSPKEISSGTFFFVYPYKDPGANEARRYREHDELFFEAHVLRRGDPSLIAFVSETEFSKIGALNGTYSENVTFFPTPVAAATNLISVPFSRFELVRRRQAEVGPGQKVDVLDTTVR